jgi:hypothetical protein
MTPELIQAGKDYVQAGLTIIPVNAKKKPAIREWTSFEKERRTTLEDIEEWSKSPYACGWALICGPPSENVCILDFDVPGFFERWSALVGDLAKELPTQQTGSGDGRQVAFKSSLNLRNDKLAYSPLDNKEGREIAIETRGAGGYAVLPPSFCPKAEKRGIPHKQPYKAIQGSFTQIPTIPPEEAQRLIEAARSLCQAPLSLSQMKVAPIPPRNYGNNGNGGVIDKFNELNEVGAILARNGYEMRGPRYLAPDSTTGEPGVYIFSDTGRCFSHHGNDPLNDGHSHDPFSVFTILEHGGDVRAAVKAAAEILGIERPKTPEPLPPDWRGKAEKPRAGKPKTQTIKFVTGRELQSTEFKDPAWIVPGILPEGLCLLSARPKKGKTWLALDISVAKSSGGCALGKSDLRLSQGKVLYLCREDKLRRAQKRLEKIMEGALFPDEIILAETWPKLDRGGLEALQDFLKEHDDCKMVVIDSYVKIKPQRPKNVDPYDFDMAVAGDLQSLAQERQVCILLIYHNRKTESEDPLDDVIGSTGLTGAVDAVLVLRRGRGQADGNLFVTGRDVEEQELALKFHSGEGLWELMGEAAEYAKSQERIEIINFLREHQGQGPKAPKEIAEALEKKSNSIKALLWKMVKDNEVKSLGGKYEAI